MPRSAPQSGFGSVVLLLMVLVLTVAIGYSVSQISKPSFQPTLAFEQNSNPDTFNLDAIIQTGLDGIQNVIDNQISDSNQVLNNPNSTSEQKEAAKALKGRRESDQAILYKDFGKITYDNKGKPDYSERNKMIEWQWDAAAIKKVAPARNGFIVDVENHTPINDNSSSRATSGIAGAAAIGAIRK